MMNSEPAPAGYREDGAGVTADKSVYGKVGLSALGLALLGALFAALSRCG